MSEDESGCVVLIDLTRIVNMFYTRQYAWCRDRELQPLTQEECEQWAKHAADDMINSLMIWAANSQNAKNFLSATLPWYTANSNSAHEFGAAMLDDIHFVYIKHPISQAVREPTWFTYNFVDCNGDLLLMREEDYRVLEWYRLTGTELPVGV